MENDRDDRQKILVALLAGRESYIVLHKYGESTRMRGKEGRGGGRKSARADPSNPVDILAISSPHPSQDRPLLSEMDPNKLVQEQPKLCY